MSRWKTGHNYRQNCEVWHFGFDQSIWFCNWFSTTRGVNGTLSIDSTSSTILALKTVRWFKTEIKWITKTSFMHIRYSQTRSQSVWNRSLNSKDFSACWNRLKTLYKTPTSADMLNIWNIWKIRRDYNLTLKVSAQRPVHVFCFQWTMNFFRIVSQATGFGSVSSSKFTFHSSQVHLISMRENPQTC